LISPRVGQIGWFDFHRANDLIAHGERAADRAIEAIVEAIEILAPSRADTASVNAATETSS
jgi:NTE family protein